MNIPNILTILRILLVPVFVIFLIQNDIWMALFIFILASITDGLDGLIARLFNQKSVIGAYLDPIADKFLLISAYLVMTIKDMLPAWLTVLVVSRDVIILSGVVILSVVMDKKLKIQPSFSSKVTTVLQVLTVALVLFSTKNYSSFLFNTIIITTAFFTVLSGLMYVYNGVMAMSDIK